MRYHALRAALSVAVTIAPLGANIAVAQETPSASVAAAVPAEAETAPTESAPMPASDADIPSPEGLVMPKLEFTATPEIEQDFDKYFYFHRANTSFAEAYVDIHECDALASGSSIYLGGNAAAAGATAQYGVLPAAIGGAIAGAMMDAIFGSSARREQRRRNLRNCMHFKDYKRYGLSRDLWTEFNFEEGMGRKKEGRRNDALALQALVASGPAPVMKELGL